MVWVVDSILGFEVERLFGLKLRVVDLGFSGVFQRNLGPQFKSSVVLDGFRTLELSGLGFRPCGVLGVTGLGENARL